MKGVLSLALLGQGWTIATPAGEYKITAEKACEGESCKDTGKVEIDERGFWILTSLDVDMRWASPDSVEIRKPRQSWVAAELKYDKPTDLPPAEVIEQVTRWERGVLPGIWTLGTDSCKAGTRAWFYQPLVEKVDARAIHGKDITLGELKDCDGGEKGVYPGKKKFKPAE